MDKDISTNDLLTQDSTEIEKTINQGVPHGSVLVPITNKYF